MIFDVRQSCFLNLLKQKALQQLIDYKLKKNQVISFEIQLNNNIQINNHLNNLSSKYNTDIEGMKKIFKGNGPVILSQPHGGTFLTPEMTQILNKRGCEMADTDWHIHRLYDGLLPEITVVEATFSRYLIDTNRDPSGNSLYPGRNTTELCPSVDFEGLPIYQTEAQPDVEEIETRRKNYHAVYHTALSEQIERVRKIHGRVLLFDCHSIRSRLPFLFEGGGEYRTTA